MENSGKNWQNRSKGKHGLSDQKSNTEASAPEVLKKLQDFAKDNLRNMLGDIGTANTSAIIEASEDTIKNIAKDIVLGTHPGLKPGSIKIDTYQIAVILMQKGKLEFDQAADYAEDLISQMQETVKSYGLNSNKKSYTKS